MVYPADEPETAQNGARSDAQVAAMVGWLRDVMSGFTALSGKPIGVIYACSSRLRPGMAVFDWIGCDDYGSGCLVTAASGAYDDLLAALLPDQRLMVVAGGADPWRQDPACFESYAHRNPKVAALIAFIWQDHADVGVGLGIRSNGLRKLYCETGRKVRYGSPAGC